MVTREEERPRTANTVSITFMNFDPIEVPENQPVKERKWELRIINVIREKKEVRCMARKKTPNQEENRDPMEVELMNT